MYNCVHQIQNEKIDCLSKLIAEMSIKKKSLSIIEQQMNSFNDENNLSQEKIYEKFVK